MYRVLVASFALLACFGCKRKSPPANLAQVAADDGGVAEARFNGTDDEPRLSFAIDAVHEHRKPTAAAPWHEPGGDWTFFDAHLTDETRLGFGMLEGGSAGALSFGKGMLTVPDTANGARLAERLASTFHGQLPPARPSGPLRIAPISIAILGKNRGRSQKGFAGAGSWTATKLFLQRPGIEAEVFFNFDLVTRRGELTEKDSGYANDLVAFVARELRDGVARAPETDP